METPIVPPKEEYVSKKQIKEQEREHKQKIKKVQRVAIFGILALFVVVGIIILAKNGFRQQNQTIIPGNPKIEITPTSYDIGTVSMAKGLVKRTYVVKNVGVGSLKIDKIWTSCMCTSALLKHGERTSPTFGMVGMSNNPLFWSEIIQPGDKAELEVTFDPAAHGPQGVGSIARTVSLSTNDPQQQEAQVQFSGEVVP